MTIAIITLLIGLSGYLGAQLHAATTENFALRANVAFLRRRLAQP
jgi:hypothetical protein